MTKAKKNEQKAIMDEYIQIIAKEVWSDEKMLDFIRKDTAYIIRTEKGYLIPIKKPTIEKSFCFGYSLSRYDSEDYDRANKMAEYASKSEEYFKEQNLKGLRQWLEALEYNELYIRTHYYKSPSNSRAKTLVHLKYWDYENMSEEQKKEYEKVSGTDKAIIREAYEKEIANFEKRLDSYLKKYGTSKLKTWSYWQDA